MKRKAATLFLLFLLLDGFANGGGPLEATGPGSPNPGQPFVWDVSSPVRYTVDGGPLSVDSFGKVTVSNAQGIARIQTLFQNWSSVSTTSIKYSYAGLITAPGLASNGDVQNIQDFDAVEETCDNGAQSPVIFDADGSILAALGLDQSVIAFSGICKTDVPSGHIVSALIFLTGFFLSGSPNPILETFGNPSDFFDEAATHEMGHLSGLGHSQINVDMYQNGYYANCPVDELAGLPLMFPILFCQTRKSAGLPILAPDDMAWISKLYPASSTAASYGTISGFVLFPDGLTHYQGANVIAREVDDPSTPENESQRVAFSVVSGFEFTGNPGQSVSGTNTGGSPNGSRNPAVIGYYEIPVTPGTYTVQIEDVDSDFTQGSSVGPLDPPVVFGLGQYWNNNQSGVSDFYQKVPVTVAAGQKLDNINLIIKTSGSYPRFDPYEDGEVLALPYIPDFIRRFLRKISGLGSTS